MFLPVRARACRPPKTRRIVGRFGLPGQVEARWERDHLCHLVEDHVLGEAGSADYHRVIEKVVGNSSACRNALTIPLACVVRDCESSGRTIVTVLFHDLKFVGTGVQRTAFLQLPTTLHPTPRVRNATQPEALLVVLSLLDIVAEAFMEFAIPLSMRIFVVCVSDADQVSSNCIQVRKSAETSRNDPIRLTHGGTIKKPGDKRRRKEGKDILSVCAQISI